MRSKSVKRKIVILTLAINIIFITNVCAETNGFVKENGYLFYYENNEKVYGFKKIDGVLYHFSAATGASPGWKAAYCHKWYQDQDGKVLIGMHEIDGIKHYFDENGYEQYGLQKIGNDLYYFSAKTGASEGWKAAYGHKWYQDATGKVLIGMHEIDGIKHYFDENGYEQYGLQKIGNDLYYFSAKTGASEGWKAAYGHKWYQDKDGKVLIGMHEIDGIKHYFDENGYEQYGLQKIGNNLYYFSAKTGASKGWKAAYGHRWYQDENGVVVTGLQKVDNETYYFDENGYLYSGFKTIENNIYYFNPLDGKLTPGWKNDGTNYWYQNNDGILLKGYNVIEGSKYYFNENTGMRDFGFKTVNGKIYFFSGKDGRASSGWKTAYGNTWYQDGEGALVTGKQSVEGRIYNFDSNGYVQGFKTVNGQLYYYNPDGTLARGVQRLCGKYYMFDSLDGHFMQFVNQRMVIDVSKHQGIIDWDSVKNSGQVDAVILRLGIASDGLDSQFKRNVSELNRLGIPYTVYLFSLAENGNEAAGEANFLVNTIKSNNAHIADFFPVFYDLEDWTNSYDGHNSYGISKDAYRDMITTFSHIVEQNLGVRARVYASKSYITDRFPEDVQNYATWVAQWNDTCTYQGPYEGWQYTSDGTVPGITGRVDKSIFYY